MDTPHYAFFEGDIVPIEQAKVSIMTHALHYGTAAFAGLRAYWNADENQLYLFRPLDHFKRFRASAELLYIDLPYTPEKMRDIVISLLCHEGYHTDTYIRPLVYKSQQVIGVRLHNLTSDLAIFAIPFGNYLEHEEGINVTFSSWRRVDDNAIPPRGKICGAYVNSALTKTEAALDGFDDALVLDQEGHIAEASAANFFMVRNGKVITPPVYADILEGITRNTCITLLAEEMGLVVEERPIDRTELFRADEAFLCGTAVQIAAIVTADHHRIGTGKMGPLVTELRRLFFQVVHGELPQYRQWVEPVYSLEPIR
ncbi:MAG: branched-chain amino acid transaminase [Anaerolineae bacterium]|nr:branched-chain amino acid transaminase [Anaerolineae bacterium]